MEWVGNVIHGREKCAQNFVRKNLNFVHEHKTRVSYPLLDFIGAEMASLRLSHSMWLQQGVPFGEIQFYVKYILYVNYYICALSILE
jgi:hypothetical protein